MKLTFRDILKQPRKRLRFKPIQANGDKLKVPSSGFTVLKSRKMQTKTLLHAVHVAFMARFEAAV